MTRKHLIEGPVILGTAQCQHMIAVRLIPPGTGALEPYMTNKFVRRFDPPTAQRIAPSTERAVGRAAPMLIAIVPAIGNRFGRFVPLDGLHRGAIVGFGHPMEVLRTVVVIAHLTRLGKQGLDMFPYPRAP